MKNRVIGCHCPLSPSGQRGIMLVFSGDLGVTRHTSHVTPSSCGSELNLKIIEKKWKLISSCHWCSCGVNMLICLLECGSSSHTGLHHTSADHQAVLCPHTSPQLSHGEDGLRTGCGYEWRPHCHVWCSCWLLSSLTEIPARSVARVRRAHTETSLTPSHAKSPEPRKVLPSFFIVIIWAEKIIFH